MWGFPASQQLHTFATPAVHLPHSSLQGTVKNLTTTISQIHFARRVMTSLWRTATADRHGLAVSDAAPCVTSSDVKVPRRAHKQHLSRRVACTVNKLMQIQASPSARKQEQLAAHWGRREVGGGGSDWEECRFWTGAEWELWCDLPCDLAVDVRAGDAATGTVGLRLTHRRRTPASHNATRARRT